MRKVLLPTAEVLVFTLKDGALSALAHDLKLRVQRGVVELDDTQVRASLEAGSLVVVSPQRNGADAPGLLPTVVYGEIEKNARQDVLEAGRHPTIVFESTRVSDTEVVGRLSLHGATRELRGARKDDATHLGFEVQLDQREFGIKPYSAMLGTLKVKPVVRVVVRVPRLS